MKDGSKFCPKCGKDASGGGLRPDGMSGFGAAQGKAEGRKIPWKIFAAVAVAAAAVLAVWYYNASREYSIVGEWESTETVDVGEIMDNWREMAAEDEDVSQQQLSLAENLIGSYLDTSLEDNVTLGFYERGEVDISFVGLGALAASFASVTYEQMPNDRLNVNVELKGELGDNLPLRKTFNLKCKVRKNRMTLYVLGQKIEFRRKD